MKIYTRTGDKGETGLYGGTRVSKDESRIQLMGDVDELNSALGVARAYKLPEAVDKPLAEIQGQLMSLGATIASLDPDAQQTNYIGSDTIAFLERTIDRLDESLLPLKNFILPGGVPGAAYLLLARTICRRAERKAVSLNRQQSALPESVICYLNRVSDLLFVMGRATNAAANEQEIPWFAPESP